MKANILVIEDAEHINELVCINLETAGYTAVPFYDGDAVSEHLKGDVHYDLALLDVMLPGKDGFALLPELRAKKIPVIFLTARGEEFDELECFECGADDFITKPFSPTVLVKRIEARLKRTADNPTDKIIIDGLVIDVVAHSVVCDGQEIELTHKEYGILHKLASNRERVFSREQLLDDIWGFDFLGDSRTVDSHVARLRTKLGDWGSRHLRTVYGAGYKIEVN